VTGKKGIVSASHELASFCGASVLQKGGNVVDAAIATSAVLTVVQNNMCGLGGDLFALLKLNGNVFELNGSGRAGSAATIDFYKSKGYTKIPSRGPLASPTVPGIVRAWKELAKHATMEFKELLGPALSYAESGVPLTQKYAGSIRGSQTILGKYAGWTKIFLPGGKLPVPGEVFFQKDLGRSLKEIREEGPDAFYEGKLSELIVRGIEKQDGILAAEDFRNHQSTWKFDPISTDYRGVRIFETSPNSQGATILLWLNMLETFDFGKAKYDSEKVSKILIDTGLKAYAERAKAIADPEFYPLPKDFLSKSFAQNILESENITSFAGGKKNSAEGDTTYFSVMDSEGNCMSVIQSNYMGFGSGLVPEGTGIVLHNRGSYFSLNPKHHNSLIPGKRTFHTLTASLAQKDGETLFAIGSMGGDPQPQINVQIMTQVLDFHKDLQSVIDQPRWIVPMTIYEKPKEILFEGNDDGALKNSSRLRKVYMNGYSSLMGHAQAIYRIENGLLGAADPRGDGASVGF
jgi:gamma-glutamyltranspeptidase